MLQDRGRSSLLSTEDLKRIVGAGAYDQHGKGNVNVGDGGVAFLLASSGAIPGGAPLVSHRCACAGGVSHMHLAVYVSAQLLARTQPPPALLCARTNDVFAQ